MQYLNYREFFVDPPFLPSQRGGERREGRIVRDLGERKQKLSLKRAR